MGISEIYIVKRDGKRAPFSLEKIKRAISKAFLSVGGYATDDDLTSVLSRVHISDGMNVEEIQNQVEVALMAERYFAVAKSYMLYRQKHTEDREDREKLEFLINYCDASNPATGSKYDANANVENKNIATLIGELPKAELHPAQPPAADRPHQGDVRQGTLGQIPRACSNGHFIYKNDETSMANYCASITMYPWLLSGTLSVGGNSTRPTNLKSFCGGFVNMVFIVSSMLSGACATPEFLMYMNYFIEQEYGEDYYTRADEVVDLSKKRRHDRQDDHRLLRTDRLLDQPAHRGAQLPGRVLERRLLRPLLFRKPVRRIRLPRRVEAPTGNRCRGCRSVS